MRGIKRKLILFIIIFGFIGACKDKDDIEEKLSPQQRSDSLIQNIFSPKINGSQSETKEIFKGKIAPDFKLKTVSGSEFQLSSIEDKFIILDFWGSWCVPCLKDFPKMKDYYNKYKSEIEIIGIAYLDSEKNWKLSVKKHELDWINVINDITSGDQDLTFIYGVESFPTKFILNKNREIIGKYGTSDVFYKKIDELIRNSE